MRHSAVCTTSCQSEGLHIMCFSCRASISRCEHLQKLSCRMMRGQLSVLKIFSLSQFDDAVVAKELALTDSEHSDAEVSYTENGTFNLSRGQTPLTEGSEGTYCQGNMQIFTYSTVLCYCWQIHPHRPVRNTPHQANLLKTKMMNETCHLIAVTSICHQSSL